MRILLGPVLHHEPPTGPATWRFSVHVMTDIPDTAATPVTCRFADAAVTVAAPVLVAAFPEQSRTVWAFVIEVARTAVEQHLAYTVSLGEDSRTFDGVAVPALAQMPRTAFFSCNGFSSAAVMRQTADPNALWIRMLAEHRQGMAAPTRDVPCGVHVLLGGGDQLYADMLPALADLDAMSSRDLRRLKSSGMRRQRALREYLDLYTVRWSHPDVAAMLGRVPGVFTWDDHDIFDGWGSHGRDIQENEAYLDVYFAARAAFRALQLGGDPSGRSPTLVKGPVHATAGPFVQFVRLHAGNDVVDVLLTDSRSERTPEQVFSATQWELLRAQLDAPAPAPLHRRHLLVVSSIPVVYLRFRAVGWILRRVPGVQEIEDDLLDQWEHPAHLNERARFILSLLQHQKKTGCRVTILSGDVHAGALGRIESTRSDHRQDGSQEPARITQITSSGIVHPSPSSWQRSVLELLGTEGDDEVASGVTTRMLAIDSETDRLWTRNFLLLDFEGASMSTPHQLWARFVPEGRRSPRSLTIPPLAADA